MCFNCTVSTIRLLAVFLAILSLGASPSRKTPVYSYRVVHIYPHDPNAFTQGLIYLNGLLYESTGLWGRSSVRAVALETGKIIHQQNVPSQFFAEGLTDWAGNLVQLTWQTHVGFVYNLFTFQQQRTFQYDGEGWGLTHDGAHLIMSDGTPFLRILDPKSFRELKRIKVTDGGSPVENLNELEYVKGEVYANIWQTDRIARISPASGEVTGWIDLTGLLPDADRKADTDVLNGVAYDPRSNRLFVTGKLWPKMFEIQLVPRK
jgi:glutaminyl-peptide cyclotransferase